MKRCVIADLIRNLLKPRNEIPRQARNDGYIEIIFVLVELRRQLADQLALL